MSVISAADYLDLANFYANARDQILGAKDFLFDAVYEIVLLQSVTPEVELLRTFWDSYLINTNILQSDVLQLAAVRVLNQHVLSNTTYTNIDAFLSAEGIEVPQSWADLCSDAGFTVSAGNIE